MSKIEKDYEELLNLFNQHKVEYCIVGAYAVAFHALPRYTKDLDLLVRPNVKNGKKIIQALKEFGFAKLNLSAEDFAKIGTVIQLGYEPVRIDLITAIDGCTFNLVWKSKKKGKYGKETVHFIGLKELIRNKRATNRKQDQADLETLAAIKKI